MAANPNNDIIPKTAAATTTTTATTEMGDVRMEPKVNSTVDSKRISEFHSKIDLNPTVKPIDPFFKLMVEKTAQFHDKFDQEQKHVPQYNEKKVMESMREEEEFQKGLLLIDQRVKRVMALTWNTRHLHNTGLCM
jgi:hypothetical protein